jgi:hypothetical protein
MTIPEFPIHDRGPVSRGFLAQGLDSFAKAAMHVRMLPYGRNSNRTDRILVLTEGRGTCSGKHALLAELAAEQGQPLELLLGFFRQAPENHPRVAAVLQKHGLAWYPEFHCYLRWQGQRLDFTGKSSPIEPDRELFDELVIRPDQVEEFKTEHHRHYLAEWLQREGLASRFDLAAIWAIREACIGARAEKSKK